MEIREVLDSLLAAAALSSTVLLLGAAFLLILRTQKFQFSLRFLLLTVGCIALALGLWTAVLRGVRSPEPSLTIPQIETDTAPAATPVPPSSPRLDRWNEPMDGPYEPRPIHPPDMPMLER